MIIRPYEMKDEWMSDTRTDDEILSKKESMYIYFHPLKETLNRLTDNQAGKLFKAALEFGENDKEPDFSEDVALGIAFDLIKDKEIIGRTKYITDSRSRSANGRQGGRGHKKENRSPDDSLDEEG